MTETLIKPTKKHARKVLEIVSHGLCKGVGVREPGKLCVEAAVCLAFDLPHGDNPPCVGPAVRSFKIALNDCAWSSDEARGNGMRRIAVAQLGSNEIDQNVFVKELALATIRKIVPLALRAAAGMEGNAAHKDALEAQAVKCEAIGDDLDAASAASYAARAASDAARAAGYAARAASDAAGYAARAASDAAGYAARAAGYAARAASDAAGYAARAASAASDNVLSLMAEIGVEALQKCGCKGCEWLDLVTDDRP